MLRNHEIAVGSANRPSHSVWIPWCPVHAKAHGKNYVTIGPLLACHRLRKSSINCVILLVVISGLSVRKVNREHLE